MVGNNLEAVQAALENTLARLESKTAAHDDAENHIALFEEVLSRIRVVIVSDLNLVEKLRTIKAIAFGAPGAPEDG